MDGSLTKPSALIVDLNNFANFPTLAVGLIVASLRNAGHAVDVLCPLAYGAPAVERERRERRIDDLKRRVHLSTRTSFHAMRDLTRDLYRWWDERPDPIVLREVARRLDQRPGVLLLSAYLQHYRTVAAIGRLAEARGVPVLLGGPMFNLADTAAAWRAIPGLAAIYGGEAEPVVSELVTRVAWGADLVPIPGVMLPDGRSSPPPKPLRDLDQVPVPDFADFPWDSYRVRIAPVMTGRGCQWGKCDFCSDVISASGRSYRTRSLDAVMTELREMLRRHGVRNFLFLDLKLNSNPAMFRGIAENIQTVVPDAQWIGTVHVDTRADNGLGRADLKRAAASGMRRISFGLESGSQALLDRMRKGSTVEGYAEFIRNAWDAGLSIRATMFVGYPGETAADLAATADFLEAHQHRLDRVRLNLFSIPAETPVFEAMMANAGQSHGLQIRHVDHRISRAVYDNADSSALAYRRQKARVLRAVHAINRKPARLSGRVFDGMM